MKLVGASVAAMILAAAAGGPAAAQELMDAASMEATFSGMSLTGIYDDGSMFSEIYAPDGTLSYVDANGHLAGTWEVRDNTFCTFYEDGQSTCLTAEQVSDNCYVFAEPAGAGKGKGEQDADMDLGVVIGWSAIEPSTCAAVATAAPAGRK
jgi:hypothetical protein